MNNTIQRTTGEGVVVRIGKIILALALTGIIGVGGFCGGVMLSFMSGGLAAAIIFWGVAIILWFFAMKGLFFKKSSLKKSVPTTVGSLVMNKDQKAVVAYIVQSRMADFSDQTIHSNLYGAGWTSDDISFGFEAVGGKK